MLDIPAKLRDWIDSECIDLLKSDACVAVAVSGGADSMALALALADVLGAKRVCAVSVDHGLRHGSAAEARWTQAQLADRGIACTILSVTAGLKGNLQAEARTARYRLLDEFCAGQGIEHLFVAHSLDDQAETFLARAARGSGVVGLSAMAQRGSIPLPDVSGALELCRPFLSVRRSGLRAYLSEKSQRWSEDPSNTKREFDRIRFRHLLNDWENAGFSIERLASVTRNMARADAALVHYTQTAEEKCVRFESDAASINLDGFSAHPEEVRLRILRYVLAKVGERHERPRMLKLQALEAHMHPGQTGKRTLAGCIITLDGTHAHISREAIAP